MENEQAAEQTEQTELDKKIARIEETLGAGTMAEAEALIRHLDAAIQTAIREERAAGKPGLKRLVIASALMYELSKTLANVPQPARLRLAYTLMGSFIKAIESQA